MVRSRAAVALGRLGHTSEEAITRLLALLQDEDSQVRSRAANALGNLGKASAALLPKLTAWIEHHQDAEYVGDGINVLWSLVTGQA